MRAALIGLLVAVAGVAVGAEGAEESTSSADKGAPRQLEDLPPALAETLRTAREQTRAITADQADAASVADAWGKLGMLYHAQRLRQLASEAYSLALAAEESPRWRYLRGIVRSERGDVERALTDFRHVVKAEPDNATARYRLGVALFLGGAPQAARAELEVASAATPDSALFLAALADVEMALGDYDAAVALLTRAWRLEPEAGQLAYKLALANRGRGNVAEAKLWLSSRPDNSLAPSVDDPLLLEVAQLSRSARFFELAAEWALARGDHEQAARALRDAVALAPEDTALGLRLVAVLAGAERFPAAIKAVKQVLDVNPDSARGWHFLAWLQRSSTTAADRAEAADATARSLALDADNDETRALAAALAMRDERFSEAAEHYRRLTRSQPAQATFHYWLGMASLGAGDCQGREALATALRLATSWGEAHLALARADAVCGDGEAALRRARAVQQAKDDADTRLTLAFAALALNEPTEAARLAKAELPHPDARMLLAAMSSETSSPLPLFAQGSPWWLPALVR